jgi:hypothetical protein
LKTGKKKTGGFSQTSSIHYQQLFWPSESTKWCFRVFNPKKSELSATWVCPKIVTPKIPYREKYHQISLNIQ